jgi:hypothetical protein
MNMKNIPASDVFETTRLLRHWSEGDETALEQLVPLVERAADDMFRQFQAPESGKGNLIESGLPS